MKTSLSVSHQIRLILIIPTPIWEEKKTFARSIATYKELASVMIDFHQDRTAGETAALGAAT